MTDLVIPFQFNRSNQELKWSIYGFRKHLHGLGNIFIIGDEPGIEDIIHVPFKDGPNIKHKDRNIYNKLLAACNDIRVSDTFLFADDDHFLLSDYEAAEFPNYYQLSWHGEGKYYVDTLINTLDVIGEGSKYFDLHCPMLYNKQLFIKTFQNVDWDPPWGYRIKSVYGNINKLEGEQMPDCKIRVYGELPPPGRRWFSTADKVFSPELISFMHDNFGN